MTAFRVVMAAAVLAGVSACAAAEGPQDAASGGRYAAGSFVAEAKLKTPTGADAGTARIREKNGGLEVTVAAMGISPGPHGVHVHTTGKCEAPDFASAGGHWNPTSHQHGAQNPAGPHAGDLPNLMVGADGKGSLTFMLPSGTFDGLLDEDGSAFVVHAGADDLKTDPSGNSGGRIACGVFAAL